MTPVASVATALAMASLAPAAASCGVVAALKLDRTTIEAAETRAAGAYARAGGAAIAALPAFRRACGSVQAVDNSHVGFSGFQTRVQTRTSRG